MSTKENNMDQLIQQYISSFTPQEKIAYNIAIEDLQTSFDIVKSIGFKNWLKNYNEINNINN